MSRPGEIVSKVLVDNVNGSSTTVTIDKLSQYKFLLISCTGQDGGWFSSPCGYIDIRNVTSASFTARGGQTSYTQSNNWWTRDITVNIANNTITLANSSNNYGAGASRIGFVTVIGIK